jgi:hypothetical protein
MNLVARVFNYPSKNFFKTFSVLFGFCLASLLDNEQIEQSFLLQVAINFSIINALFLSEDIMSIFTQAQNNEARPMIHLKMSKLRRNLIFGICIFLIFSYFYFNFSDVYEYIHHKNTIDYILNAFAGGGVFIALSSWREKNLRLKPVENT